MSAEPRIEWLTPNDSAVRSAALPTLDARPWLTSLRDGPLRAIESGVHDFLTERAPLASLEHQSTYSRSALRASEHGPRRMLPFPPSSRESTRRTRAYPKRRDGESRVCARRRGPRAHARRALCAMEIGFMADRSHGARPRRHPREASEAAQTTIRLRSTTRIRTRPRPRSSARGGRDQPRLRD